MQDFFTLLLLTLVALEVEDLLGEEVGIVRLRIKILGGFADCFDLGLLLEGMMGNGETLLPCGNTGADK